MKSLACILNGHQPCHEATNGDYRNCKGCILHKTFVDREREVFLIKGHCVYCKIGGLVGSETWFTRAQNPRGYTTYVNF